MRIALIVKDAINNFGRHRLVSVSTTITISLILMIFSLFLLVFSNLQGLGSSLRGEVMITVYLQDDLIPERVQRVRNAIDQRPEVESVSYTSKEEALQNFQGNVPESSGILQSLGENPLPASFDIRLRPGVQTPEAVRALSRHLKLIEGVDEVQDGLDWLGKYTALAWFAQITGIAIGFLLAIAVITIISSTIRISFYSRKEEIGLLRLIGAREAFIRAPFFIEGAVVGFLGAALALSALAGLFYLFQKWAAAVEIPLEGIPFLLSFFSLETVLLLILLATILGGIGGLFSVRASGEIRKRVEVEW